MLWRSYAFVASIVCWAHGGSPPRDHPQGETSTVKGLDPSEGAVAVVIRSGGYRHRSRHPALDAKTRMAHEVDGTELFKASDIGPAWTRCRWHYRNVFSNAAPTATLTTPISWEVARRHPCIVSLETPPRLKSITCPRVKALTSLFLMPATRYRWPPLAGVSIPGVRL